MINCIDFYVVFYWFNTCRAIYDDTSVTSVHRNILLYYTMSYKRADTYTDICIYMVS